MESHLQHTYGRHYDEHDDLTTGLHTVYDSARVAPGGPDAILAQPRGNLERPSVLAEDRYPKPVASHVAAPQVSTGAYGTKFSEPSGGFGRTEGYGHEANPEKWRGKIGQPTGMEEDPFAPNPTRVASPVSVTNPTYGTGQPDPLRSHGLAQDVNQGGLSMIRKSGMDPDPHAPTHTSGVGSDPSNYQTKVTNPTHTGGKETGLSQLEQSFDKMGIGSEPKSFDLNQPENIPHDTLVGNPESRSSGYADKISSSASAIADKAAAAKDAIASKLGYSGQNTTNESHETVKDSSGSATDYVHKITDTVAGTLAPVYEKVVDTGSSMISKVQGTVTGAGSATGQPQIHRGPEAATGEKEKGTDVGVSVKEYLAGMLTPGEDDKALKEVITNAFNRGSQEESEKKSSEDRPMGRVTESVEVRQRLGTDRREDEQRQDSGNVTTADKGVTERLSEAMGSWFGGKGDAPSGTLGTSYVTDEGLSSNPTGDRSRVGGKD